MADEMLVFNDVLQGSVLQDFRYRVADAAEELTEGGGCLNRGRLIEVVADGPDRRERALNCPDDLSDCDLVGSSSEPEASFGASAGDHDPGGSELVEDLFEV